MSEQQGSQPGPPPGWYEHPDAPDALRYFDGKDWTSHLKPLPQPPKSGPGVLTIARGVALGIAVVVAGLFFLAECEKSSQEDAYLDCLLDDARSVCVDPSPND